MNGLAKYSALAVMGSTLIAAPAISKQVSDDQILGYNLQPEQNIQQRFKADTHYQNYKTKVPNEQISELVDLINYVDNSVRRLNHPTVDGIKIRHGLGLLINSVFSSYPISAPDPNKEPIAPYHSFLSLNSPEGPITIKAIGDCLKTTLDYNLTLGQISSATYCPGSKYAEITQVTLEKNGEKGAWNGNQIQKYNHLQVIAEFFALGHERLHSDVTTFGKAFTNAMKTANTAIELESKKLHTELADVVKNATNTDGTDYTTRAGNFDTTIKLLTGSNRSGQLMKFEGNVEKLVYDLGTPSGSWTIELIVPKSTNRCNELIKGWAKHSFEDGSINSSILYSLDDDPENKGVKIISLMQNSKMYPWGVTALIDKKDSGFEGEVKSTFDLDIERLRDVIESATKQDCHPSHVSYPTR